MQNSKLALILFLGSMLLGCSNKPDVGDIRRDLEEAWSVCKGLKMTGLTKTNGIDKGGSYEMGITYKLEFLRDIPENEISETDAACPKTSPMIRLYTLLLTQAMIAGTVTQPITKGSVITVNDVYLMVKSENGWIQR